MGKTKSMKEIELEHGKPIVDVLNELYAQHGTQAGVASALGIHQSTLWNWLLRLNLEQRTILVRRSA